MVDSCLYILKSNKKQVSTVEIVMWRINGLSTFSFRFDWQMRPFFRNVGRDKGEGIWWERAFFFFFVCFVRYYVTGIFLVFLADRVVGTRSRSWLILFLGKFLGD